MVTFVCLILQATRPTTLKQKEDLMHTSSKRIKYQPTHTDSTSHGGGRLINFSSLQKIVAVLLCPTCEKPQLDLQEKPMGQSGISYKLSCELKPVYGQQIIQLYEQLSRPDLLELCKYLHTTNANEHPKICQLAPQILETGVAMSVLEFNYGSRGIRFILRKLWI